MFPRGCTVSEVLEKYLDWVHENRKPATYDKAKHCLTRFAKNVGYGTRVANLKGSDVSDWVETESTWGPTMRHDGITAVVRAFNWAVGKNHLRSNPVLHVPDKPSRKRREIVFSTDDWKTLRGHVKDCAFGDLLDFMYETGCRPLEARTLQAHHLDLRNDMAVFPPSEAKGERNERVIFLTDKAKAICARLVKRNPTGPLMLNTQGRPWTKDSINCRFHRPKKKLGKDACAYAVRHTYATEALKAGMDSLTLSQLMGHSNTNTLAKTYAHLARNPDYLRKQARRIKAS